MHSARVCSAWKISCFSTRSYASSKHGYIIQQLTVNYMNCAWFLQDAVISSDVTFKWHYISIHLSFSHRISWEEKGATATHTCSHRFDASNTPYENVNHASIVILYRITKKVSWPETADLCIVNPQVKLCAPRSCKMYTPFSEIFFPETFLVLFALLLLPTIKIRLT